MSASHHYDTVAPFAALAYDELAAAHLGKPYAQREEHPDGSVTIALPLTRTVYRRDARGFLHEIHEGREYAYPLFVTPSRYWGNVLGQPFSAIAEIIIRHLHDAQHEGANTDDPNDPDAVAYGKAIFRHAHRISGSLFAESHSVRARKLAKALYGLVDPAIFSLIIKHTPANRRSSRQYNLLNALPDPNGVNPALLALYLTLDEGDPRPLTPDELHEHVRNGSLSDAAWGALQRVPPRAAVAVRNDGAFLAALASAASLPNAALLARLHALWEHEGGVKRPAGAHAAFAQAVSMFARNKGRVEPEIEEAIVRWVLSLEHELPPHAARLPYSWWRAMALAWRFANPLTPYPTINGLSTELRQHHDRLYEAATDGVRIPHAVSAHQRGDVLITPLDDPARIRARSGLSRYLSGIRSGTYRAFTLESPTGQSTVLLHHDDLKGWRRYTHYQPGKTLPDGHAKAATALARAYRAAHPERHEPLAKALLEETRREIDTLNRHLYGDFYF
jgi:hypothetical protein